MKKPTIQEIAATAGVSTATVDRVLNNRTGVRQKTIEKVHSAILRLDYKPYSIPPKDTKCRLYRFLFVIRKGQNTFMYEIGEEIENLAKKLKNENIHIEKRIVDSVDGVEAANVISEISPKDWDGIAVLVPDLPLVRQAISDCTSRGIKVVTLVSDLPSSMRSYFIGIDNVSAGRTAGRLIGRFTCRKKGKLAFILASKFLRDHIERWMGCEQVIITDFPHLEPLPPFEGQDNHEATFHVVDELLSSPDAKSIVAIYGSGAANRGLIEALHKHGRQHDIVTISHEITPSSRRALLDGTFDAILSQDLEQEVHKSISLLKFLCDEKVPDINGVIGTDIFLPDNLP